MSQEILDKSNQTCTTSKEAVVIRFLRIIEKKKDILPGQQLFHIFFPMRSPAIKGIQKTNKKIKSKPKLQKSQLIKKRTGKKNVNKCSN